MRGVLVAVAFIGACVQSSTVRCGDRVCPENSVCSPDGARCATQAQLDVCTGKQDGDGCSFPGTEAGACDRQVCIASGCGNGVVERASGEICDDGNRISTDGCSADCKSLEMCGDGVADPSVGEHCDCGTDAANLPFGCNGVNSMQAGATCRLDCTPGRCGDGVTDLHELCDDGNNIPGDGCRADCTGRWTKLPANTLARLADVSASSATDAWAVGGERVLRWDGSAWTVLTLPAMMKNLTMLRVHVVALDDVFVLAREDILGTNAPHVFRYLSGSWSELIVPSGSTFGVLGGRGSVLYLGGTDDAAAGTNAGRIAQWDGGNTFVNSGAFGMDGSPRSISVLANGTAFAADAVQSVSQGGNVFRKLVGGSWTLQTNVHGNLVTSGPNEMFVFTRVGTSNVTLNDGGTYIALPDSAELSPQANSASGVAGFAIMVGSFGEAMLCQTATPGCVVSDTGVPLTLLGVSVIDDKHAFIVGDNGTILY